MSSPSVPPKLQMKIPSDTHREKFSAIDSVTGQLLFLGGPWAPARSGIFTLAVLTFLSYIPMKRLTP